MSDSQTGLTKPTRMFVQFFWWLKNVAEFHPDICIDVGAAGGTPSINRSFKDALHLAFEPQPGFMPELRSELDGYQHEIFQMALMDRPGKMEITIPENAYTATMISPEHRVSDDQKLSVEVSTLDAQLAGRLDGKNVLLKTDCQGGDLNVIKGGTETLRHCDVVIMETSLYRFWGDHHPDFFDIVSYMKSQGLVVFDILEGTFKPSNRALGQVDLVFVHENGPLRPHHRW